MQFLFKISCYLKILLSSLLIKFLLFSKKKIINFFIYFFNMQFFPLLVQITFFYVCLFFFSLNFVTDITLSRAKGWWWIFQLWWWRRVWWNGRYGLHPWGLATSKHFSFCSLARSWPRKYFFHIRNFPSSIFLNSFIHVVLLR